MDATAVSPLIGSKDLASRLGVTRMTVTRWRLAGFLPKPVHIEGAGVFWLRSTIEAWEAAGRPWADPRLARAMHQKLGSTTMNEYIAPQADGDEPRGKQAQALIADLEAHLDACELLVGQLGEVKLPQRDRLKFLIGRMAQIQRRQGRRT